MEDLASWFSIAKRLNLTKHSMQAELDNAEKTISGIKESLEESRIRLLEMLSEDSAVSLSDINLQERHLQLLGRLFIRKRTSLVRTAASHCLTYFRAFSADEEGREDDRQIGEEILDLISGEEELPTANDQLFKELQSTIGRFLEGGRTNVSSFDESCHKRPKKREGQKVF